MKRKAFSAIAVTISIIIGAIIFWQSTESPLIITEILPCSIEGKAPWIELHNPSDKEVNASGLKIVIDAGDPYTIPQKLPPVPPKKYILYILDGKGEKENIYSFKNDKPAVLHSISTFKQTLNPSFGQVALYDKTNKDSLKPIAFVRWGLPTSNKSLPPAPEPSWQPDRFIPTIPNFGVYSTNTKLKCGYSIGLFPRSETVMLDDWCVYTDTEVTPGKENAIPRPENFTLPDDAVVKCEDIAVGWVGNKNVKGYLFQLHSVKGNDVIIKDNHPAERLKIALYKPAGGLPEGVYSYRVKSIDGSGRESAWSRTMTLRSQEPEWLEPPIILEKMEYLPQHKDTYLLCRECLLSDTNTRAGRYWDKPHHGDAHKTGDHGEFNCARASIAMMVSFYGKSLSQDHIAYYEMEQRFRRQRNPKPPRKDPILGHGTPSIYDEESKVLKWALCMKDPVEFYHEGQTPSFDKLSEWLNNKRPIMTRKPGHVRTMDGCGVDSVKIKWVHILDPKTGKRWQRYEEWKKNADGTWVGPPKKEINAQSDEPFIWTDLNGDGIRDLNEWTDSDDDDILDFDEMYRFHTDPHKPDTDDDQKSDKDEIRESFLEKKENGNTKTK